MSDENAGPEWLGAPAAVLRAHDAARAAARSRPGPCSEGARRPALYVPDSCSDRSEYSDSEEEMIKIDPRLIRSRESPTVQHTPTSRTAATLTPAVCTPAPHTPATRDLASHTSTTHADTPAPEVIDDATVADCSGAQQSAAPRAERKRFSLSLRRARARPEPPPAFPPSAARRRWEADLDARLRTFRLPSDPRAMQRLVERVLAELHPPPRAAPRPRPPHTHTQPRI